MIEIFLFTKNENDFISIFIKHHLSIVDKITVIDNGSTDGTWEILQELSKETDKLNIQQHLVSFHHKARILTHYMKKSSSKLLISLDTDELLAYEDNSGTVTTDRSLIKQHLIKLSKLELGKIKIKQVYNFIPNRNDNYFSKDKYNKFIFLGSDFDRVDTGSHIGFTVSRANIVHLTNIVYLHFHYRNLNAWLKSTEQKLKARLGDNWNNIDSLLAYKKPRPSHHVALEYINYLQTGIWSNLQPYKQINHNIKLCQKQY